jgi:hypothetical protein
LCDVCWIDRPSLPSAPPLKHHSVIDEFSSIIGNKDGFSNAYIRTAATVLALNHGYRIGSSEQRNEFTPFEKTQLCLIVLTNSAEMIGSNNTKHTLSKVACVLGMIDFRGALHHVAHNGFLEFENFVVR